MKDFKHSSQTLTVFKTAAYLLTCMCMDLLNIYICKLCRAVKKTPYFPGLKSIFWYGLSVNAKSKLKVEFIPKNDNILTSS